VIALLVGGVGYIGYHLAGELARQGHRVVVLSRPGSVARRRRLAGGLRDMGARVVVGPVSGEMVARSGADAVYYLPGKPGGPRESVWEAHYGVLKRVLPGVEELGARLVYVSSIAVTADLLRAPPGSVAVEEERHLVGPGRPETFHSESKMEGERLTASYRGRWSIVRPGLVYGGRYGHFEWRLLRLACRFGLAPGSRWAPVVSVEGLARLLALAGEGRADRLWINAVEPRSMLQALRRYCGARIGLELGWLVGVGRIAGRGSVLRLAWSIVGRKNLFRSRHPGLLGEAELYSGEADEVG